jgi:CheY-like chemotaxis protein
MTTEQNQPQAQPSNQAQPGGPSEGQGHRRRRRRRKGYANNQAKSHANGEPGVTNGQAHPSKKAAKAKSPGQNRFMGRNGNGANGSAHTAMNNGANGGGGRRKGKQRRQQTFVGPMDHSYRVVNGNTADAPHSAAEFRGNGQNGHYVDALPRDPVVVPVREDAPVRIYCFIEDLFFLAKIQEAARKIGVKVAFVKADKDIVSRLADVPEGSRPSLIVFDLNNVGAKPLTLIPRIKSKLKRGTSVIGFLSHLQGDLKAKAMEAGCDMVMPRSAFSQNLPNLLRRHGLDSELEAAEA